MMLEDFSVPSAPFDCPDHLRRMLALEARIADWMVGQASPAEVALLRALAEQSSHFRRLATEVALDLMILGVDTNAKIDWLLTSGLQPDITRAAYTGSGPAC